MAITLKKIVRQVRYKQKDNNEIKYSDYDIVNAVNECIRYINQSFSLKNSDFLEKIHKYREAEINEEINEYNSNLPEGGTLKDLVYFAETGVDPPTDFMSIVDVLRARDKYHLSPVPAAEPVRYGAYKVISGKIYCKCDFDLLYRAEIPEVKDISADSIELPIMFLDLITKVTGMILLNNADTDVLMNEVTRIIDNLVPGRRYANVKRRMPFRC